MSRERRTRISAGITAAAVAVMLLVTVPGTAANALIGDPTIASNGTPGATSVPATQGKAAGSGLWGYVGDVETRTPGANTGSNVVWTYGLDFSPLDGSLWVTDSAKAVYSNNGFVCEFNGGTLQNGRCYSGVVSTVNRYGLAASPDWAIGQYSGNGTWTAETSGANGGIGANFQALSDATIIDGTTATAGANALGTFGGARGIAVDTDGTVWVADPDYGLAESTAHRPVRLFNPDGTETTSSFGSPTWSWADRYKSDKFEYNVSVSRMASGNFLVTNGGVSTLVKEFAPDGSFVRTIHLPGGRSPYNANIDPTDGTILMRYTGSNVIERIDPNNCTPFTPSVAYDPPVVQCAVLQTITLPASGDGFTIGVDPLTGQIYAGLESNLLYVYEADGTYLGRFSPYGNGNGNGQIPASGRFPAHSLGGGTVRDIAFDARGFMYLTVGEGSANTRVEIFARTPDPITGLTAAYNSAKTSATLSWDALALGVTDDAQVPVKDYVIELSTDGGTSWTILSPVTATAGTTMTTTVTGLNSADTHLFRVSAWGEAGNGDTATATPTDAPAASIGVVKADEHDNVTPTVDDAIDLASSGGSVGLVVTVTNTGDDAIENITVADVVTGSGTVTGLDCDFLGDGSLTGTTWAGPFLPDASFECTATLDEVTEVLHTDTITASGTGVISDLPVTGTSSYYAVSNYSSLTLVKKVSSGDASPSGWTLTADGPTPITGKTGADSVTDAVVTAGLYTLTESGGPSGYQQASLACVAGDESIPVVDGQVRVAPGADVTCTFTNRAVASGGGSTPDQLANTGSNLPVWPVLGGVLALLLVGGAAVWAGARRKGHGNEPLSD